MSAYLDEYLNFGYFSIIKEGHASALQQYQMKSH